MDLGGQRGSDNIEDRRGMGMGGGLGIGGIVIAVIAYFLGFDPSTVLNTVQQVSPPAEQKAAPQGAPADEMGQFVSKVLGSTEDVWTEIFRAQGQQYRPPKLVLYTGATRTACGTGQQAMGPFYCPLDHELYIDLSFYRQLTERFHAPGQFAEAYVIAHEVGHHIQTLTGIMDRMDAMRGRVGKAEYNQNSVKLELQADCYAGIWAHNSASAVKLTQQDIEQGLNAASAIGDDKLQKQSQGYVVPESFTHGSSAQRVRWFKQGMDSGRVADCDTFGSRNQ
jgi:predicted metalloprotease